MAASLSIKVLVVVVELFATWTLASAAPDSTPPPDGSSITGKTEALTPRGFSLEDRYLDAARRGDLAMLKMCLDKGVDAQRKDGFGRSALLLAARDGHNLEMVEFLHAGGLPVDDPDYAGRSPLAEVAASGQLNLLSWFLEHGAKLDRKDSRGQTVLYSAVLGGSEPAVRRLLEAGAQVDVADQFGDTPLMGACSKGFEAISKLLVAKGADPARKDQEGRTARDRAAEGSTFCRGLSAPSATSK